MTWTYKAHRYREKLPESGRKIHPDTNFFSKTGDIDVTQNALEGGAKAKIGAGTSEKLVLKQFWYETDREKNLLMKQKWDGSDRS